MFEVSEKERKRVEGLLSYERRLWAQGFRMVAGIDEAGRGPLAGPVVSAAVVFEQGVFIPYINDSKKLRPEAREILFDIICEKAFSIGIGIVDEKEIDQTNILQATYKAMRLALADLKVIPDHILIDGRELPGWDGPQTALLKGDSRCFSIAAASIIAKVTRDRLMVHYDKLFPQYGFARHKGYSTREHREALRKYGPCQIHRRSFRLKYEK